MKRLFASPPGMGQMKLWICAALSAVLACAAIPWFGQDDGIPSTSELAAATGQVAWVDAHRYGVKFRFAGDSRIFDYPSKARANGLVEDSLSAAANQPVVVRFNPKPRRPLLVDGDVFDAWEIAVGGKVVRSWADSADGWRSDNAVRPWLAAAFGFCAVYLAVAALRMRRSGDFA